MPLLFIIFFLTKLFGYVDIPIMASLLIVLLALPTLRTAKVEQSVQFYFMVLCLLACYAMFISTIHAAQEIIFAFKFLRTLLLFSLLYYVWLVVSKYYSYETFLKFFTLMVFAHAVIVLLCVSVADVRDFIYSITGYVPRGPAWSRSPGLTVSYNTPSILHVLGLWLLATRANWPVVVRIVMALVIAASLIFMGKTIAILGLLMIFTYLFLLSKAPARSAVALSLVVLVAVVLQDDEFVRTVLSENVYTSVQRFVGPLQQIGSAGGVDSYFAETLSSHIYFSTDPVQLVFGNALSGHIGLIDPVGQTDSDLGLINSINANGIFVTVVMYAFYLLMFWQTRKGDWKTVSFLVVLPLLLSVKETGFFTSHATPVLFFLFFYVRLGSGKSLLPANSLQVGYA